MRDLDHDIIRFEGEGGPSAPERDEGVRDALPQVPELLGLQKETLPLAPPDRPLMLGDTSCRIALVREDDPQHPIALDLDFTGEDAIVAQSKLVKGHVEIAFTSGFGRSRSIQLSPAEFMLVLAYGDRFFQELPRS